ncbi:MAG TPA: sterol desaturase family protein [Blastocatellia bacterium]|nr:sterol desaturase family protein [Blastocatellia bacterium]
MPAKNKGRIPGWISLPLTLGAFGALVWLEWRRPLRRSVEPKLTRVARNLAVAAAGGVALGLAERPVTEPLAQRVERNKLGLLKIRSLPPWVELPLAVVLMDYTLYLWHYLTHRVPLLWRFHVVHHADLDLDVSTALRFHFGELLLSVPWRAAQVRLVGVSPLALSAWQTLLFVSIMFHHSNVRLPLAVERRLNRFIVTPRMHGIHHSTVRAETDSNWSSGLTLWDRLHGTLRLDVPQGEITIGVPAYRRPDEVTLPRIIGLPFGPQRPAWRLDAPAEKPDTEVQRRQES